MESIIRKLEKDEFPSFVDIVVNAYPGFAQNTVDFKERYTNNLQSIQENDDAIDFFGLFRNGRLLGGMRIHYFTMNIYGQLFEVGGVGLVAVDLLHKKEKVAKDLISYFTTYFQERGAALVTLYPFRPDFYKKMGFGYGTKMNQYTIAPSNFPISDSKKGICYLDPSHKESVLNCANRYVGNHHGMILKTPNDINALFKHPDNRLVGYMKEGELQGYLAFTFKSIDSENFLMNNLIIKEFVYETPEALQQICHFLNSQADQINRVIWNTQDEDIEFLLNDSRNGSNHLIPSVYHETKTAGIGLMYKIIDVKHFLKLFPVHNCTCKLGLVVHNTFECDTPQKWLLSIEQDHVNVEDYVSNGADVEIEIDISDLSSLLMGAVEVKKLIQYGKLKINNEEHIGAVHQVFSNLKKPLCTTAF